MRFFGTLIVIAAVGAAANVGLASAALAETPTVPDDGRTEPGGGRITDPGPGAAPDPAPTGGDAEAAPTSPTPPAGFSGVDGRRDPRQRIAVMPRFAYRLASGGGGGRAVTPAAGFGIGGTIEVAYLRGRTLGQAALGIDFSYDRFATGEEGAVTVEGEAQTFRATRTTSETSFVLVHTISARAGPTRPYLTVGAGLGLGYFESAAVELRPGSTRDAHILGRVSLGIDFQATRTWNATVRVDYTAVGNVSPFITQGGERLALFGSLINLAVGIAYRF